MSRPVVIARNLGKRYRLHHQGKQRYITLRDTLTAQANRLMRRGSVATGAVSDGDEEFWAIKDVNFEIQQGDVVGIIGRNGAGKSTLLKLLSRITEPTTGRMTLRGRVASLLEVGTGFHPELSGRENIFLNGAILGMRKPEIHSKFDEIVEFAEVERFLDTPVKHYSSGMYVRLAFAVAAHLEPEILIVDEVLAVGDASFQKKCMARMRTVAIDGRTVLFVSHNMAAVTALCDRGLLLQQGSLVLMSDIDSVVSRYRMLAEQSVGKRSSNGALNPPLFISELKAILDAADSGHRLVLEMFLEGRRSHAPAFVAFDIVAENGTCVMQALPTQEGFVRSRKGLHVLKVVLELPPMVPGSYSINAWVGSHYTETIDLAEAIASFEIVRSPTPGRTIPHSPDRGFIVPRSIVEHYHVSEQAEYGQ